MRNGMRIKKHAVFCERANLANFYAEKKTVQLKEYRVAKFSTSYKAKCAYLKLLNHQFLLWKVLPNYFKKEKYLISNKDLICVSDTTKTIQRKKDMRL